MPLKKSLLLGASLFLLSLLLPTSNGARANSHSITGSVTDQNKKPLTGAMITAYDAVENKTISVFSKAGGRFRLGTLADRDYKVRVRLPGFEDEFINVVYKSTGSSPVSFRMKPVANSITQHTSVDRIRLIKWPNDAARLNFRMACAYCHQVGTEGFRAP